MWGLDPDEQREDPASEMEKQGWDLVEERRWGCGRLRRWALPEGRC